MDRWLALPVAIEIQTVPLLISHQHPNSQSFPKSDWHLHWRYASRGLLLSQKELLNQNGWSHPLVSHITDRRITLRYAGNWHVKSLMQLRVNHGDPRFMCIKANKESSATSELQRGQVFRNKDKGEGKQSSKGNDRTNNPSDSIQSQNDRTVLGNKKDDEGSAQGLAILAALKAQLLHNSTSSKTTSEYDSPGVNIQKKFASYEKSSKLSSPLCSEKDSKSTVEEKKISSKVSDSETRMQPFSHGTKLQLRLSNLPNELTTKEFDTVMRRIPGLSSCKLLVDQAGSCLGYGFCEINSHSDGKSAIELLSGISIMGKPVIARFLNSEYPKASDTKQSMQNNLSRIASAKQSSQILAPAAQAVVSNLPEIGETQLWEVKRTPSEEDTNKSSKDLSQLLQNEEKQIAGSSSLMGEFILKAIRKASAERSKSSSRLKKTARTEKRRIGDDDSREGDCFDGELQPLIIKMKWALELKSLEASISALKKFL